ncbi:3-hydroxy-3-methylglutaryl-coenzyme A reductase [Vitis vinifera]|uniref:hydroxymethylglutaryl-CoA reductase (NADPH) n=1 Tax=Vitis vinifera TaxID=29760 RepID=A0A438JTV4_VITVI|nr:3-hydroxy-3-methylglutaryl-coenzyme A reductase [Vitis vinifera]
MDVRRRPVGSVEAKPNGKPLVEVDVDVHDPIKASDALPLPLYFANAVFFGVFFSVVYFLLTRWREKIRTSTPLHVVTLSEIAAIVTFMGSCIYLLGFFGIDFVQGFIARPGHDNEWDAEDDIIVKEDARTVPCGAAIDCAPPVVAVASPKPKVPVSPPSSEEDEEIIKSVVAGAIPSYSLESRLGDCRRAVAIRREALQRMTGTSLEGLPLEGLDYESILGSAVRCRWGCLVASTNRGCKAIYASGGATSVLLRDAMTRAPVVRFGTAKRAAELMLFLENPLNFETLALVFNRSSRFGRLQSIKCAIAGKNLYIRFSSSTGDAMGMNMISKGVQNVLDFLQNDFPDMDVIGISGNYCSDKKPTAVNWIEGRGKSVVCEAIIKEEVVKKVLKTNVAALVELNMLKNLTGSAMAGALGGFNAHASNIVSAVYIATGQDPAQNVESSHCITMMEAVNDGKDLHVSVTMPSIEGANKESPGTNARLLATIVAGSVLAGELSLMSAIAAGQLVRSHMKYNRSNKDVSKA